MKATKATRRAANLVEIIRHGQGVTYHCKKCGHTNEANAYYEADHKEMIRHADRHTETSKEESSMTKEDIQQHRERTQEWQEWMLARMVEPAFVRKTSGVKGPYTTGDFVTFLLNDIFGPSNWSHRILNGPELIQYGDQLAYSQVTVQLTVRFADGQEAIHEDIGIWPFTATKARDGGTLNKTKPERFEQVVKSAVTDGLKACTDHLGNCFRPIADLELEGFLRRRQAAEDLKAKGKNSVGEPTEKARTDLFGEEGEAISRKVAHNAERHVEAADASETAGGWFVAGADETTRREVILNAKREGSEAMHREMAHNAERRAEADEAPMETELSLVDATIAKYKNGESDLPAWVEEIREKVNDHPQASDPVGGNGSFIKQLEASAGRKVTADQFRAFVQIVLTHPLEEVTFGEAAVLMNTINADDFEAKVVSLLS